MLETLSDSVETADFGDERLNRRFVKIVDSLSDKPNMSIPAATKDDAGREATYRFFNNKKVSPPGIRGPHVSATQERIRQIDVALLVQDTTEIDLTRPNQQVAGTGPLEFPTRFGAFYHPLMAFDADGIPLGEVWNKTWIREKIETQLSRAEKTELRKATPIEDKESIRWVEGLCAAQEVAKTSPTTQCVCIGDSEADIYELFAEPRDAGGGRELHLLVRACHNRVVYEETRYLLETLRACPCLFEGTVDVSKRTPKVKLDDRKRKLQRDARIAAVETRAMQVTFRPPRRPDRVLPQITLNVVLVDEPNPPEGQQPIQWILLTTLPIDTHDQVRLIVKYYKVRWQIEVYFRTLKSGCRIESRYFEKITPLLNCIALYAIVAWKILYLCRLSKECPDLDCEIVFDPSEWKAVYMVVHREAPPATPPTLNEMIKMIASLGGYVIRAKTEPGTQTLWLGLQRAHDLSLAWNSFGPGAVQT